DLIRHSAARERTAEQRDRSGQLAGLKLREAAVETFRERRLAGAGGPHEHDELAAMDVEVDRAQRRNGRVAIRERHAAQRDDDLLRHHSNRMPMTSSATNGATPTPTCAARVPGGSVASMGNSMRPVDNRLP